MTMPSGIILFVMFLFCAGTVQANQWVHPPSNGVLLNQPDSNIIMVLNSNQTLTYQVDYEVISIYLCYGNDSVNESILYQAVNRNPTASTTWRTSTISNIFGALYYFKLVDETGSNESLSTYYVNIISSDNSTTSLPNATASQQPVTSPSTSGKPTASTAATYSHDTLTRSAKAGLGIGLTLAFLGSVFAAFMIGRSISQRTSDRNPPKAVEPSSIPFGPPPKWDGFPAGYQPPGELEAPQCSAPRHSVRGMLVELSAYRF